MGRQSVQALQVHLAQLTTRSKIVQLMEKSYASPGMHHVERSVLLVCNYVVKIAVLRQAGQGTILSVMENVSALVDPVMESVRKKDTFHVMDGAILLNIGEIVMVDASQKVNHATVFVQKVSKGVDQTDAYTQQETVGQIQNTTENVVTGVFTTIKTVMENVGMDILSVMEDAN